MLKIITDSATDLPKDYIQAHHLHVIPTPVVIDEVDYLLGVFDSTRQGSLRYSVPDSDDWLSASNEVPPIIELKRLLFASNEIARGNERNGQIKELLGFFGRCSSKSFRCRRGETSPCKILPSRG